MQFDRMKRREFITLLGGAAGWPLAARAQQPAMPVVGFLSIASPAPFAHLVAGLRRGLQDAGFVEGRDVAVEYRWAEGRYDRLPELAADLVHRQVAVIVTSGGDNPSLAAKAATTTIPIVFNVGSDPVKVGLVASLAHPGGNATGVNIFTSELAEKRFGLLNDAIPAAASFAVLANPNFPPAMADVREVEAAGRRVGKDVAIFHAGSEGEIDSAFARMAQSRPGALLLAGDPFFNGRREQIVALAARHAIPAIYEWREFAEAGGLMSYGTNLAEAYRLQGVYAGRILKGEKTTDLPVVQLSKFDLVINLKTAKALGLEVPPMLLARADEVRAGDQSQDGQGNWAVNSVGRTRHRQRGDRIALGFAALHESGYGTKRRRPRRRIRSAFGRAAEVHGRTASVSLDADDPEPT
jgi:putative tryptophan/tyrosine transport system substrate-binding protein